LSTVISVNHPVSMKDVFQLFEYQNDYSA